MRKILPAILLVLLFLANLAGCSVVGNMAKSGKARDSLDLFLNNSPGFKNFSDKCLNAIGKSQYMAGELLEETTKYPGYEGFKVQLYEYHTGTDKATGKSKRGLVYMLNPSARQLATWIATAVWKTEARLDTAMMNKTLNFIRWQSGVQFPVCGIVYEDMYGKGYYPYLFKDGVTVYTANRDKWASADSAHTENYSCSDEQLNYDTHVTDAELKNYTGRYARICSTTREMYRANGGNEDVGTSDSETTRSLNYLHTVRDLYKAALHSNENPLITAWVKANL